MVGKAGFEPAAWAVCFDYAHRFEVANYLLAHGARHTLLSAVAMGGYVERVREILTEDPDRAQAVSKDGYTPLWWLPDDEAKAMRTVELLLAAGADPSAKNKDGETAAEWARRGSMCDVATRLDQAAAAKQT